MVALLMLLFPGYYTRVWNEEILKQKEEVRKELYLEYPNNHDVVDECLERRFKRLMK